MSSRKERNAAELRAKAAAAEIQLEQLMREAEKDLKKTRVNNARKLAGLPPTHEEVVEEKKEEERKEQKSRTLKGRFKSMFKKSSRSSSPPAYNDPPPAYNSVTPRGGTKRGKKTRRIKKTKKRRTLLKNI